MDSVYYIKVLAAFVFVLALMYLIAYALKRWGGNGANAAQFRRLRGAGAKSGSLRIVDSTILDYRRRLVLVEYNKKGYLVMLGPQSETVVAAGVTLAKEDLAKEDQEHHDET
jgi:flagellar biogenesis protein FliO